MKFRIREVKDGGCVQYSYDGENQFDVMADTGSSLMALLSERYSSKVASFREISNGYWAGGFAITLANNVWLRVMKVSQ